MEPGKKLYFIIGIGRSGTTLLTKLLNNHPAVHALPEANFPLFFLHAFKSKKQFTGADIDLLFEQIEVYALAHPYEGWAFNAQEAKRKTKELIANEPRTDYAELCKFVYNCFEVNGSDKGKATILLDKNPGTTLFLDEVDEVFKEARYIFLIRDHRANVLSRKQNVYMKTPHVGFNACRWLWFNKRADAFRKKHGDRVLVSRYEDLVESPEQELKRICDFFEIEYREDLAAPGKQYESVNKEKLSAPVLRAYAEKKYADLAQPVNTARVNAWQDQLSAKEIKACDIICSDFAAQFNYPPFTKIAPLQKSLLGAYYLVYYLATATFMNKEVWVNHFSPATKLQRLKSIYKKHGFGR